ncbi:MAG: hypothetical protein HUU17_07005 [Chthonomonadales bacterium]|nr:hypothetical protein [Chthonomonadales bacterium]
MKRDLPLPVVIVIIVAILALCIGGGMYWMNVRDNPRPTGGPKAPPTENSAPMAEPTV